MQQKISSNLANTVGTRNCKGVGNFKESNFPLFTLSSSLSTLDQILDHSNSSQTSWTAGNSQPILPQLLNEQFCDYKTYIYLSPIKTLVAQIQGKQNFQFLSRTKGHKNSFTYVQ